MQDAQQQLLNAQSEAARVQKAKTMMDVETLRIGQRIEILNNISTQATLLAGSSIAFLSGEALETVDDEEHWSHAFGRVLYVLSGSLALVSALWVIVIASHLIALTRDASLRKNILKASRLLDKGMREVRGVHQFALGFLLMACGTGAVINMELVSSIIVAVVFTASALQVVMKQQARPYGRRLKLIKPAPAEPRNLLPLMPSPPGLLASRAPPFFCPSQYLSVLFYEEVELEPEVAAAGTLDEIYHAVVEPLRPVNIRRMLRMWEVFAELSGENLSHQISWSRRVMGSDKRPFQPLPSTKEEPAKEAEPRRPGDVPRRVVTVGTGQGGGVPPTSAPQSAGAPAAAASSLES